METIHFSKQCFFIRRHKFHLYSFQTYFQHLLLSMGFLSWKTALPGCLYIHAFQSACGLSDFTLKVKDPVLTLCCTGEYPCQYQRLFWNEWIVLSRDCLLAIWAFSVLSLSDMPRFPSVSPCTAPSTTELLGSWVFMSIRLYFQVHGETLANGCVKNVVHKFCSSFSVYIWEFEEIQKLCYRKPQNSVKQPSFN